MLNCKPEHGFFFSYSYISALKWVNILFFSLKNMQDHRYSQPQSDKDTSTQLHTASQQDNSNQTLSLRKRQFMGGQRSANDLFGGKRPPKGKRMAPYTNKVICYINTRILMHKPTRKYQICKGT